MRRREARQAKRSARRRDGLPRRALVAAALGLLLLVAAGVPLGPLSRLTPTASAHAVLVKSEPAANAILQAPPSQVRLWFSEAINPFTSKAVVVDPTNHEVDRGDSHRNPNNDHEMDVSLQLLPAGTYIVDWRTQSEEDGHIVGSSFIFRIARPDGSVPPVPKVLPTGHFPGAAGAGVPSGSTIDAPTAVQGLGTFLALLLMTFWVGGVFWETWILPPSYPDDDGGARDPDLERAARAAARRFARLAPYALGGVIVADVVMILGQSAELAGSWQGAASPVLLRAILFGSRFGTFWWLRQLVALAALLLAITALQRGGSRAAREAGVSGAQDRGAAAIAAIPDWRRELLATAREVRHLPRRLVRGWQERSGLGRIECLLAGALLVAFALSGHAAAVPANQFAYAIAVDLLHLLCEAAWIGGLFYIGVVLIPALGGRTPYAPTPLSRARVLALGLPEFGAVAIICATLLAATGSLNTTIHLDNITQFLTTSYGRTLAIKIELFLVMVGISFYHAFVLRPRLSRALNGLAEAEHAENAEAMEARGGHGEEERTQRATAEDAEDAEASGRVPRGGAVRATRAWLLIGATAAAPTAREGARQSLAANGQSDGAAAKPPGTAASSEDAGRGALPPRVGALADKLRDWLRREALLAGAVLLCVALLGIFAGSLVPTAPASASGAGASPGVFLQTQQSGGYAVTLKVTPATFGTNTFTVTIKDAQGKPVTGAAVVIEETMLDMDMGTQNAQLQPIGASAPGSYSGQAELTMAGHWQIAVKVLLPKVQQPLVVTYKFSAGY